MKLSPRWQQYYMKLADHVATGSKDGSNKFGAILVRPDKTVSSIGFNGFPARISDDEETLTNKELRSRKYPRIVHAEVNCLNHSRDFDTTGYHMFVNAHPCERCALSIAATGIQYVYYKDSGDYMTRWADSIVIAKEILSEANVELILIEEENDDIN